MVVALVTRTIRGIDTEVQLGPADGMPVECAVSLDNLRTVPRALLTESITKLDPERMADPGRVRSSAEARFNESDASASRSTTWRRGSPFVGPAGERFQRLEQRAAVGR